MDTEDVIDRAARRALRDLENGNRTDAWERVMALPVPIACAVVAEMAVSRGNNSDRQNVRSLFVNRADNEPKGWTE